MQAAKINNWCERRVDFLKAVPHVIARLIGQCPFEIGAVVRNVMGNCKVQYISLLVFELIALNENKAITDEAH